ncbi:MAG: ral nucleoside transport system permease protein [Acidimicrobiia bacterium]|jgi:simple sugar transport system permease protein|nr:ral nucleoside transport system permease protein [Acidimicrobiia bacterium]
MTAQMETTTVEPDRQEVVSSPVGPPPTSEKVRRVGEVVLRWTLAILGALVIFGAFMAMKGVDPLQAYREMWHSTFTDSGSWGGIAVRAAPVALTALAVAVPARAGLINVGGEGQLVLGGVAAAGVYLAAGDHLPGSMILVLMLLAAAVAGAVWAALAAVMRLAFGINEAVTTLLSNYIALDIMLYLIYSRWKDPQGSGQPATRSLPVDARLPLLGHTRVHVGVLIAVAAAVLVSLALSRTAWGFRLRVVGGNPEAARRAGLRVGLLLVTAMAVGGALAGLGGAVHLAGAEFKLRQGFGVSYGYIGFLASWLARHKPIRVALAAGVLSAIAVAGDSLQIDAGLPAASVNILMALVLLAAFGWGQTSRVRPTRGGAR